MDTLLARVQALPYDFPPGTEAVHLRSVPRTKQEQVSSMAAGVTPICAQGVLELLDSFLKHKCSAGAAVEQSFYASMTCASLFTRLLCARPLAFWGHGDRYVLQEQAGGGRELKADRRGGFEEIGTDEQQRPLVLEDYLSYDEMQMAALISVAVPSLFVNSGDRGSKCLPGEAGSFQESGVIIGCVGARMVKEGRMESEHMLVTPRCTAALGYGPQQDASGERLSHWARFYRVEHLPSYEEATAAEDSGRFQRLEVKCQWCNIAQDKVWMDQGKEYCAKCMTWYYGSAPQGAPSRPSFLDGKIYKGRIRATVEPFLVYTSHLGITHEASAGRGAHVRVKGLGLGAWWVHPVQERLMKEVYAEVLAARELPGIEVLEFAFFPSPAVPVVSGSVQIRASSASLAEPVEAGMLLVTMYAWDGNAHPGNEWWAESGCGKYLGMTDDSAAASCSLITSLQHPAVNRERLCAAAAQVLRTDGTFGTLG